MVNYKEIIRLAAEGTSQRQIASSLRSSRNKVSEVLELAKTYGLTWPLDGSVTNEQLEAILFPNRYASDNVYLAPDFAYIHKELAKTQGDIDAPLGRISPESRSSWQETIYAHSVWR